MFWFWVLLTVTCSAALPELDQRDVWPHRLAIRMFLNLKSHANFTRNTCQALVTTLVIILIGPKVQQNSPNRKIQSHSCVGTRFEWARQNKRRTTALGVSSAHFFRQSRQTCRGEWLPFFFFIPDHLGRAGPEFGSDGPRTSLETLAVHFLHAFLTFLSLFSSIPSRWVGMLVRPIIQTNHARHEDQICASTLRLVTAPFL